MWLDTARSRSPYRRMLSWVSIRHLNDVGSRDSSCTRNKCFPIAYADLPSRLMPAAPASKRGASEISGSACPSCPPSSASGGRRVGGFGGRGQGGGAAGWGGSRAGATAPASADTHCTRASGQTATLASRDAYVGGASAVRRDGRSVNLRASLGGTRGRAQGSTDGAARARRYRANDQVLPHWKTCRCARPVKE
jgi:hypothetical protein